MSSLFTTPSLYFVYAFWSRINKEQAVTWWALRERVTLEALIKDSAVPGVATFASASAVVHPLPSSHPPITFRNAISMWRSPNMTTNFFSPYRSLQFHWISFATAKRGWSKAITGTWPGFRWFTESLMISTACLIIAMDLAWSGKRGNKADVADAVGDDDRTREWNAPQETTSSSFSVSWLHITLLEFSSHLTSSLKLRLKTPPSGCILTVVAETWGCFAGALTGATSV